MLYFPSDIEFPFNVPMLTLEELPLSLLKEPFFNSAVERHKNKVNVSKKLLPLDQYSKYLNDFEVSSPKGFIFHPSRAGSTLVSQMLVELDSSRVLGEPLIIDKYFLKTHLHQEGIYNKEHLKNILLGFSINEKQEIPTFFKFSSLITHDVKRLVTIFPETPWVYIYRNPIEVIVSNLKRQSPFVKNIKKRGLLTAYLTNSSLENLEEMSLELIMVKKLAENIKSILSIIPNENGLIINYKDIKPHFCSTVLPHFGIEPTTQEIERISERSQYYSKTKNQKVFSEDSSQKQLEASDKIKAAVEEANLYELMKKLEKFDVINQYK